MTEDVFPKTAYTLSGTNTGWTIEARITGGKDFIELEGGQTISHRWTKIEVHPAADGRGVESRVSVAGVLEHFGLLSYAAAQSIRWSIHSAYEARIFGLDLETRLVKHDVKYSMSATPVSPHGHIHGDDRSSLLPDWNKENIEKKAKEDEKQRHIASLENIIMRRDSEIDVATASKTQIDKHKLIKTALEHELEELKKSL